MTSQPDRDSDSERLRRDAVPPDPWPTVLPPIPLTYEERVALATLRLLISSGRLDELHPPADA